MDQGQLILALVAVAVVGLVAVLAILSAQRRSTEPRSDGFAASTEGETRCPSCGMGNLWTDARCVACGARLA
ncbi:MAG TPA: hypothetical protein VEY67_00305 [Candidatus Dormibacteraeota bacterium]|nr:hypothetical protein [Candidatus Dormibacteraeota bacterium]